MALHEELIGRAGHAAVPWLNYGHALRALGRVSDAVAAYRKSLEIDPGNGFAWWGLAGLRTIRFEIDDIALMEGALANVGDTLQQVQLHFALGSVGRTRQLRTVVPPL
ncbi:tetratricopeptide repeat protein [Novosphingobium sp.]|uniref:tetratricopeptide repeat protein n=1 Tax=Novosphingobium sp. TaxID=1874826 RepID=UPI003FA55017